MLGLKCSRRVSSARHSKVKNSNDWEGAGQVAEDGETQGADEADRDPDADAASDDASPLSSEWISAEFASGEMPGSAVAMTETHEIQSRPLEEAATVDPAESPIALSAPGTA